MPSPFPGMNPYIERAAAWHEFHKNFLGPANPCGPGGARYFVRIDEHMYIHELPSTERRYLGRGDILVPGRSERVAAAVAAAPVLEAPAEVGLPDFDTDSRGR